MRLVARTEDEELECAACFELLPLYVDLEVAGENPDLRIPLFRGHLEQCAVCREEYETVRELARLDVEVPGLSKNRPPTSN
jgi:predicted anti-sigma-YlaC factor YlaD